MLSCVEQRLRLGQGLVQKKGIWLSEKRNGRNNFGFWGFLFFFAFVSGAPWAQNFFFVVRWCSPVVHPALLSLSSSFSLSFIHLILYSYTFRNPSSTLPTPTANSLSSPHQHLLTQRYRSSPPRTVLGFIIPAPFPPPPYPTPVFPHFTSPFSTSKSFLRR